MPTIAVIGSGGWGTAIAVLLAGKGYSVRLWCANEITACELQRSRVNRRQLPGVAIPDAVTISPQPTAIGDADTWIVAVPTVHLDAVLPRFLGVRPAARSVVSLTKGITGEFQRPSERIRHYWKPHRIAVLSGPNHAEEIARGLPASAVVASADPAWADECRELFGTPRFRIYSHRDPVGVELAGAYKNVLGIAAGMCDGLALGDNAKAALLTRGLAEMSRFGVAHGAEAGTFAGLAGMGDLIATCFSPHGRNRRVGERIAKGESLETVVAGPQVAEGVNTTRNVVERARQTGLDLPIASAVHRVLFDGRSPLDVLQELMSRSQKDESNSSCSK
jgi:glycerol-3-phosphate dehydrogenase (NAD(P)+)